MLRHSPVVIGDTICRESRATGVVIYSTIRGGGVVIGSTVSRLLFTAQFGFAARGLLFPTQFKTVVIHGTFLPMTTQYVKKQRRTVQYGAALFFARGQEFCRVRICCKLLTCIPIPLYKL